MLSLTLVDHIGMYCMPGHQPVQYFNQLPKKCVHDVAIVLDHVIESILSMLANINILK